jgi:formamidase
VESPGDGDALHACVALHGHRRAPHAEGALLGGVPEAEAERVAREAARTWAARENGGNVDVKELSRGSRAYLPVYVDGAHLSVGDLQFSQGDGKITGLGGIKMAGFVDLHVDVIRGGMERFGISNPVFEPGPTERGYSEFVTFQGSRWTRTTPSTTWTCG